jgi:hypothetical protein
MHTMKDRCYLVLIVALLAGFFLIAAPIIFARYFAAEPDAIEPLNNQLAVRVNEHLKKMGAIL